MRGEMEAQKSATVLRYSRRMVLRLRLMTASFDDI